MLLGACLSFTLQYEKIREGMTAGAGGGVINLDLASTFFHTIVAGGVGTAQKLDASKVDDKLRFERVCGGIYFAYYVVRFTRS